MTDFLILGVAALVAAMAVAGFGYWLALRKVAVLPRVSLSLPSWSR
ncbi:hypothetical protein [Microbulbifer marinus]|nr:hypothetical protein [Microbulbifer marinus]